MLAFAVSVIGLCRNDFDWMLPVEYVACLDAWSEAEEEKQRRAYEVERFGVWLEHGKQNSTAEDICTLPWEKKKITGRVISYGKTNSISKAKPST